MELTEKQYQKIYGKSEDMYFNISEDMSIGQMVSLLSRHNSCYSDKSDNKKLQVVYYHIVADEPIVKHIDKLKIPKPEKEILKNLEEHIEIYIPKKVLDISKTCKHQFYVVPLFISVKFDHWNLLIFDLFNKTVERYEPYFTMDYPEIDDRFKDIFNNLGFEYIPSENFCIRTNWESKSSKKKVKGETSGFQNIEGTEVGRNTQNCGYWSLLYIETRLANPSKSRNEIVDMLSQNIKSKGAHKIIIEYKKYLFKYINLNQNRISKIDEQAVEESDNLRDHKLKNDKNFLFYEYAGHLNTNNYYRFLAYNGKDEAMFEEEPSYHGMRICEVDELELLLGKAVNNTWKYNNIDILNKDGFIIGSTPNENKKELNDFYNAMKINCKAKEWKKKL